MPRHPSQSHPGSNLLTVGVLSLLALAVTQLMFHEVPWEKEYFYSFERDTSRLPVQDDIVERDYMRTTVHFESQGVKLEGWFYQPLPQDPLTPPPILLMAHGLGSQKDMGLHPYAEQYAQAGMAVLVFDYRGFGGSDGDIRHWVSWRRHCQDVQAAVDWVQSEGLGRGVVDTSRMALWGVSYSGGHMLMTAANEANKGKIKALVANEPYLSSTGAIQKAFKEGGLDRVARLLLAALLDKGRELVGGTPIYIRLIGVHPELAILNVSPEELALSRSGQPNPPPRIGGWKGIITARMMFDNLFYKPIQHVHKIDCPVMLVAGTKDELTPAHVIRKARDILGDKAELVERPYGHIEMHRKMMAPEELAVTVDFLRKHLGLQPAHVRTQPHEEHPEEMAAEVL